MIRDRTYARVTLYSPALWRRILAALKLVDEGIAEIVAEIAARRIFIADAQAILAEIAAVTSEAKAA